MVPRENKNNPYAKFGGQTKSIMVFSEVAYYKDDERLLSCPRGTRNHAFSIMIIYSD